MAELTHPGIIGDSDSSNRSRYIIKNLLCSFFSSSLIFNPNPVKEPELLHISDILQKSTFTLLLFLHLPYFRDHKAHIKVFNFLQNGRGAQ